MLIRLAILPALALVWAAPTLAFFENMSQALEILVPTQRARDRTCRVHSKFYVEELKRFKLWAVEMFDASSKFPSGILFGSAYDFGNFDECVDVNVPFDDDNDRVAGKYCMAKFRLTPPDSAVQKHIKEFDKKFYNYYFYANEDAVNASAWDKVIAYQGTKSRRERNDFFFSYCVPASCSAQDLDTTLKETVAKFNAVSDFKLSVSVDPKNCQVKSKRFDFDSGDWAFIIVVAVSAVIVLVATCYDFFGDDIRMKGTKHRVLMSFSFWANLKKLSTQPDDRDGLVCLHGMKVISMFLIIMGHRIMFAIGSPILNSNFVESLYEQIEATVLLNGPIIVDTFFNITGFLACYHLLDKYQHLEHCLGVCNIFLHRIIRITPAYAMVVFFYCTLFIKVGSGPFWIERVGVEQERCLTSWWANLLYVNNYVSTDNICMFQSWYLTCDMHYFLVTPFFVMLLKKKPKYGIAALCSVVVLSICIIFKTVYENKEEGILLLFMRLLKDPVVNKFFKNVYIPSHMRASPYFVGMLMGYLKFYMRANGTKIPTWAVRVGWIVCVAVMEGTIYVAYVFYSSDIPYNAVLAASYACLHHFLWSCCISWIIIATSAGYGSWISPILKWRPLVILGRITYTAFLVHGAIQLYTAAILRHAYYSSIFNLIFNTAGDIMLAYGIGFLLSMFFEAPIIQIGNILTNRRPTKRKEDADRCHQPPTIEPSIFIPKIKIISHNC